MSLASRDYAEALSSNRSLLCDRIKAETFVPVKPYPLLSRITEACETDTFSCRAGGDGGGQTRSTLQGHAGCGGVGRGGVPAPTFGRQIGHIRLISKYNTYAEKRVWAPCGEAETHTDTQQLPTFGCLRGSRLMVTRTTLIDVCAAAGSFGTKVESLSMTKSLRLCLAPSKIP